MNVWKLLSALVVGISTSTMAYAQNLDDLDLTKGILALQCSDVEGDVDTPLVFVKGDAGWVLNSSEDVVVTEIADGFRLTRTNYPNWMAFVTGEKSRDWTLRYISDSRIEETTCTNIQDLVEILTATIAPQIADNFSEIANDVADTIPTLRAELNDKTMIIADLEDAKWETELLNQQVAALRRQLGDLQAVPDDAVPDDVVADTIPALRAVLDNVQRQKVLLSQQVAALRTQVGDLQALLSDATARDAAQSVQLQSLGSDLNTALARVAVEQSKRAELEAVERKRVEEEVRKRVEEEVKRLNDQ